MKRIFSILLSYLLLLTQVAHAELMINQLNGLNVGTTAAGPVGPAVGTFLQCAVDATNLTTYTFAAQNVGVASADRYTMISIAAEDSGALNFSTSSVTVGGVSATLIVDYETSAGTGLALVDAAIYMVANPSGTSEDVVVTFSESITSAAICLYAFTNLQSATPVATNFGFDGNAGSVAVNINTQADGVALGMSASTDETQNVTWTGLNEREEGSTGEARYGAADVATTTTETPRSISCDYTGASNDVTAVSASWR